MRGKMGISSTLGGGSGNQIISCCCQGDEDFDRLWYDFSMDLPMISSTYFQRNFKKVVDSMLGPIIILRGSHPEAVIMPYKQYLEMRRLSKKPKG